MRLGIHKLYKYLKEEAGDHIDWYIRCITSRSVKTLNYIVTVNNVFTNFKTD